MLDLSRREAFVSAGAVALAAGVPTWALAQASSDSAAAAWDLREIYPTDAAWEADRKSIQAQLPSLLQYKGKLGRSAAEMRAALQAQSDLTGGSLLFPRRLKAARTCDRGQTERKSQAQDVFTARGEAPAWGHPERRVAAKVERFIAADPELKRGLPSACATSRQSAHTLSPDEEKLLASAGTPLAGPNDIRDQLAASDMPRPTVKLSDGREIRLDDQGYTMVRGAPNRADRKLVFDKFWESYKAFENSLGTALAAQVKATCFRAKARKYEARFRPRSTAATCPRRVSFA